jgi:tripartite-type tricarboxylate transporter receptor subunit TctC
MLQRRQLLARTGALALAGGTALAAQAQDLPNKTIRILVPFSAGGSPDLIARLVAQQFTEQTGVPVVIDNREAVANAVPDGTTILLNTGSHTINPSIYKKLPYDTVRDLAPISLLTIAPTLVLVVAPNFPAKNFQEFLALARQPDTRISFGSPGIGNTLHLSGELLNIKGGTHMLHVPYKGAAPALQATVAGEVSCTFLSTTAANIAIKSGQVRPLAVTAATRLASLPEVPTIAESGVKGFDYNGGWMGLFAPGKTPPATVKRLSQEFNKVLQVPSVRDKMNSWESPPLGTTPEEFAKFVQADLGKYAEIVRDAHVPMQ